MYELEVRTCGTNLRYELVDLKLAPLSFITLKVDLKGVYRGRFFDKKYILLTLPTSRENTNRSIPNFYQRI